MASNNDREFEYVIVGSGAGGGTLAARLAEEGCTVLVLEAGGNPVDEPDADSQRLPEDYHVPVFHAFCSENASLRWDFFVRHYASDELQKRDWKYRDEVDGKRVDGVLYPRAGTLGGCTAHNAMITVYPHNKDWDDIAALTGDDSWNADHMRTYFERLEDCHHRPVLRQLAKVGINPSRHGFGGWLSTEMAAPKVALHDPALVADVVKSSIEALREVKQDHRSFKHDVEEHLHEIEGLADPNDWSLVQDNSTGLRYPPLATKGRSRMGTRERLLDVQRRHPDRLTIELDALATRVLFDQQQRAVGVEYLKGKRLYRAHCNPSAAPGESRRVRATREVILAGGAFNTPQLLKLSGVGPRDELTRHGISVRVDLPGVGTNLQDRYEVGVVNRMNFAHWTVLKDAVFSNADPQYRMWHERKDGVYITNGAILAVVKRSTASRELPDLFCFALLANFPGYYPGYSALALPPNGLRYMTWAVLKAHTNNTAGTVTLRSADPRDPPDINFHYFDEGNDASGEDLESVVAGVKFVRRITSKLGHLIEEEELPGRHVQTDEELREFVRTQAWGHHASCTCPIGPRERGGVLTSDFRVHGTRGLRVVDASVFPKIPGFFIVSAVYMVGEKAADVILAARESQ